MDWKTAKATPMRDVMELVSILQEWDRKRNEGR